MEIECYRVGQMQTNCYFLIDEDKCLIIDPGDDAAFIAEEIERRKLKLLGLLATHGHFDHVMAVGEIQATYHVPLYIHKDDQFLLKRTAETAKYFLGYDPILLPIRQTIGIKDDLLRVANYELRIINTPGHTPGSVCYYLPQENVIFTGDTLFKKGIGRYDFSYSDFEKLQQSLKKLYKLPEETIVYPGHGEETTVGDESKTPFIN